MGDGAGRKRWCAGPPHGALPTANPPSRTTSLYVSPFALAVEVSVEAFAKLIAAPGQRPVFRGHLLRLAPISRALYVSLVGPLRGRPACVSLSAWTSISAGSTASRKPIWSERRRRARRNSRLRPASGFAAATPSSTLWWGRLCMAGRPPMHPRTTPPSRGQRAGRGGPVPRQGPRARDRGAHRSRRGPNGPRGHSPAPKKLPCGARRRRAASSSSMPSTPHRGRPRHERPRQPGARGRVPRPSGRRCPAHGPGGPVRGRQAFGAGITVFDACPSREGL